MNNNYIIGLLNTYSSELKRLGEKKVNDTNDQLLLNEIIISLKLFKKNCDFANELLEKSLELSYRTQSTQSTQSNNIGKLDIFQFPIDNKANDKEIQSRFIQITKINRINEQERLSNGKCKYNNKTDFQSCDLVNYEYKKYSIDDLKKDGNQLLNYLQTQHSNNFNNSLKKILDDEEGSSNFYVYCAGLLFLPEVNDNITNLGFYPKADITGSVYGLSKIYDNITTLGNIYKSRINDFSNHLLKMKGKNNCCYAVKLELPRDIRIITFGDFHASIHTLMRSLIRLKEMGYIINNNWRLRNDVYLFFLGDFVDRGLYGWEVWVIVMKLLIVNPKQVFIIRGNHEEVDTNTAYGFLNELTGKFEQEGKKLHTLINDFWRIYVPSAIFVKLNGIGGWMQFCHGGFDRNLDVLSVYLNNNIQNYYPQFNDFMWSDFECGGNVVEKDNHDNELWFGTYNKTRGAGRVYNYATAKYYMEKSNIYAVFRGHQDTLVNTKILLLSNNNCNYQKLADLKDVRNIVGESPNNIHAWQIQLFDNVAKYTNFLPIFTFSTAVSPRYIDDDGFGIIRINSESDSSVKKTGKMSGLPLPLSGPLNRPPGYYQSYSQAKKQ